MWIVNVPFTDLPFPTAPFTISIRGVFEDPVSAAETAGVLLTDNSEFPISGDIVQRITSAILADRGNLFLQIPVDQELNNVPDV